MRIGIDARMYSESGIGRYLRNLIYWLQKIDRDNEYYIFLLKKDLDFLCHHEPRLNQGERSEGYNNDNFKFIEVNFKWYSLDEQIKFPQLLTKYHLDLVHFPHFNVPIFYNQPFIVTIHDLIHQHYSTSKSTTKVQFSYFLKKFAYKKVFKNALKKSQKIITVSNFVKNQLINEWAVNNDKIIVTYEGVDDKILTITKEMSQKKAIKVLEKFAIKQPYILYIGNAHPHKNIEGLIKAFLELRKGFQYLQLVLSGSTNFFWERIKREYPNKDIIYTDYITDEEMVALYKSAKAYIQPSFEEGFGIPILEAMACGCTVISSNMGSLPEVGSDACIYFNPRDIDDMSNKISQVLNNETLRRELIEKGLEKYKQFSWEKLTERTLKVYENSTSTR